MSDGAKLLIMFYPFLIPFFSFILFFLFFLLLLLLFFSDLFQCCFMGRLDSQKLLERIILKQSLMVFMLMNREGFSFRVC